MLQQHPILLRLTHMQAECPSLFLEVNVWNQIYIVQEIVFKFQQDIKLEPMYSM